MWSLFRDKPGSSSGAPFLPVPLHALLNLQVHNITSFWYSIPSQHVVNLKQHASREPTNVYTYAEGQQSNTSCANVELPKADLLSDRGIIDEIFRYGVGITCFFGPLNPQLEQ